MKRFLPVVLICSACGNAQSVDSYPDYHDSHIVSSEAETDDASSRRNLNRAQGNDPMQTVSASSVSEQSRPSQTDTLPQPESVALPKTEVSTSTRPVIPASNAQKPKPSTVHPPQSPAPAAPTVRSDPKRVAVTKVKKRAKKRRRRRSTARKKPKRKKSLPASQPDQPSVSVSSPSVAEQTTPSPGKPEVRGWYCMTFYKPLASGFLKDAACYRILGACQSALAAMNARRPQIKTDPCKYIKSAFCIRIHDKIADMISNECAQSFKQCLFQQKLALTDSQYDLLERCHQKW